MIHYYSAPGIKRLNVCPVEMNEDMKVEMAKQIIETTAKFYGVTLEHLFRKDRRLPIVKARQASTWLIKNMVKGMTYKQISELYGRCYQSPTTLEYDHTGIVHNINTSARAVTRSGTIRTSSKK